MDTSDSENETSCTPPDIQKAAKIIIMVQNKNIPDLENDAGVQFGKLLAHPPPGEEVVITGMAGAFPLSENIDEFKDNLENKVEMITFIKDPHPEIPPGAGKLKENSFRKFDAGFFDLHLLEALTLSPIAKMLLEKSYECIFDAGLHPSDLEGTNTGVFLGICFSETELHWFLSDQVKGGNAILGNEKSAFCNRISHHLKLKGPSYTADTACSSSLFALESAFKAIRMGECDAALVLAGNMVLAGGVTLQFARLGVLSGDGHCRPFDKDGTGYVRSEAVVAILLQKAKDSKRIYARLVHTKTNCDGYKEEGITYPSGSAQLNLLKDIYFESGIKPTDMSFIEAHGTGTIVGDPEELNGMDKFFSPQRKTPLLVGSVKSSIGHSEPASGLCSIVKAILAFESNIISPNINFNTPRPTIPGIIEGRMEVVTENTPFRDTNGLVGVSSFGFGGGNAHAILKQMSKKKIGNGNPTDNLPRLVCVSGRTEEAVKVLLDDVANKFDQEHIGLVHNIFRKNITNHIYRGYAIASKNGLLKTSVKSVNTAKTNFYVSFWGLSKISDNLLNDLLRLPIMSIFESSLTKFFAAKKLNLNAILSNSIRSNLAQLLVDMLGQLALTELLKQLEVKSKNILDNTFGKIFSAYFRNFLNLNEVLECVYAIAKITLDNEGKISTTGIKNEGSANYKTKLVAEFKNILAPRKQVNGHSEADLQNASPEYFVEAIFDSIEHEVSRLPINSVILEIGQRTSMLRKRRYNTLQFGGENDLMGVLEVLGSLFEYGLQPQIQRLYPETQFPVSRGTPMISSKIKWNYDRQHYLASFNCVAENCEAMKFKIGLHEEEWASLDGHVIDGRNLFPATGYLFLAWTVLSELTSIDLSKLKVVFENCKFMRACSLLKASTKNYLELDVMIQRDSGHFEIMDGDTTVVAGTIKANQNQKHILTDLPAPNTYLDKELLHGKDIYKELRLRGYNYGGVFKSLAQCNTSATKGEIKWSDNWIAFMDNMMQVKILGGDSRLLYVPTSIAKVTIDPEVHMAKINTLRQGDEEKSVGVPVQVNSECGLIRSGGIEIRGLQATSIPRKKITAVPVLEKQVFVPNECQLPLNQAVRVLIQIALENNCGLKVKAVELIDEATKKDSQPLGPLISNVLDDQPLVTSDITILSEEKMELNINVENKKLKHETECTLAIGSKLLSRSVVLQEAINATKEEGYLISREPVNLDIFKLEIPPFLQILYIIESSNEKLIFLKKRNNLKPRIFINVSSKTSNFTWLQKLKQAVKKDQDVIAWCQNEPLNGLIGLVNCIRREPDCSNVRSLFIADDAPAFDSSLEFYKTQLDKNMGVNIYKDGIWGTYRHLLLDNVEEVEGEHCYANTTVRGDLSSIKWIEGNLSRKIVTNQGESMVEVYYSSLNFRDIMTASGRINVDVITKDRREQECVQGFEFSGKTLSGKRVMGMLSQGTLATLVKADNALLWEVPESWSLKDAATVPVVYGTCLYALVNVGKINSSDSVLIHSGTGGIGQAAINLCLNMGCTVFVTVGTEEKRKFINRNFPQIKEKHIGNSRDLSFEQMIMRETNGKGVDIILNSLAEEKLSASVRCLSRNGRFLEIGKFDLANDNRLNLLSFREGGSYHGVMLDKLFNETDIVKKELNDLVQKFIDSGAVKPLKPTVFEQNQVEQAFRFMTTGKHMGKVLVEIRKEEVTSNVQRFKGLPRYFCDPSKTYIICGGLGGFGLELADWLVLRGAKNLVLTSRKGITTGYQNYRISIWRSYECNVQISTHDITTRSGCEKLIEEANALAPVAAIFNLAVVLQDSILPNQTEETFKTSFGPKACATQYLDEVTRSLCPELRDFVVFSSISCGRGNAGQSNYGMSNSVMERICENRRDNGYPALAIQWGAIGDVGLVAEMQEDHIELNIGGTLQQSISNCIQVMDILLRQNEGVIVSSMVVAEKKTSSQSGNIMEVIGGILGIRDLKSVSMLSTLAELGMDSMNGVEVKQTLEREYDIFLSPTEIRSLTLARIQEIQEETNSISTEPQATVEDLNWTDILRELIDSEEQKSCIVKLKTLNTTRNLKTLPKIIVLPGVEGVCNVMQNLTEMLEVQAFGVNYITELQGDSLSKMSHDLIPHIKELLQPQENFHIVAHSMGANLALEVASRLEQMGHIGSISFIDGSPAFLSELARNLAGEDNNEGKLEDTLVAGVLRLQLNEVDTVSAMQNICKCSSFDEKLRIMVSNLKFDERLTEKFAVDATTAAMKRMKAAWKYTPTIGKLKSKAHLFKATIRSVKIEAEDFELGQYFEQPMDIKVLEGSHTTILQNKELAETIMQNLLVSNGVAEK